MKKFFGIILFALIGISFCFLGCKDSFSNVGLNQKNSLYVDIPDPLFRKVLNKNIDTSRNGDEQITKEEMLQLTEVSHFLNAEGKADFNDNATNSILGFPKSLSGTEDFKFAVTRGVKSIKGIEYAKNLQKFKINENEISDISYLKNLTRLTYLELSRNRIVDISPISNLVNLNFLKLYNNLIEDISSLKNLKKLKSLDIHYNVTVKGNESNKIISKGITDISVVENMPCLEFLDVSANRITHVSAIKNLTQILDIDFSGNCVVDYTGLGEYIATRYVKQNQGNGSIGFFPQTVTMADIIQVTDNSIEVPSPYKGIEELSSKFAEAFNVSTLNVFNSVNSDNTDITTAYDATTQKFKLTINDNLKGKTVDLQLEPNLGGELSWKINLKLNVTNFASTPESEANGLPRKFDLRAVEGKSFVSSIKNQYKDGGCRSFASLAALESHIKMKENIELDFSENNMEMRHGFYFGNKTREGRTRESDLPYLINGLGPVLEDYDPYTPMQDSNGQPAEYLTRDEVDNLPIVSDKPIVRRVMGFNFLKKINTSTLTSEEDEQLIQMKTAIKDNGAVVANIYMSHDGNGTFPYSNADCYNPTTYGYYSDGNDGKYSNAANHAITIVGWDDSFSKTNFIKQPPIDGAWIVKDAQTTDFGDNGFFYVSFASVSMGDDAYVFTDIRPADEYDGIFQHDEVAFSDYIRSDFFENDVNAVLFNKYTSIQDANLYEIGFYTTKPNAEYEVYFIADFDVFETNVESYDDAEEFYQFIQDYKVFDGTEKQAGYHTKKFDEAKELIAGKSFAIGIWTKNYDLEDPEHKWDIVLEKKVMEKLGHKAVVNKKETYAFDPYDYFTDINQYSTYAIGNACIKGYYKNK